MSRKKVQPPGEDWPHCPTNFTTVFSSATPTAAPAADDGPHCDGQILVLYDLLMLFDDFVPKFVEPYAHLKADAFQALRRYKE